MIERSILNYVLESSAITSALGGNKVYFQRVPGGTKMPWVCFYVPPGSERYRMTQTYTETMLITYFQIEHSKLVAGKTIAELVHARLENFRGDLDEEDDVHITCSAIRSLDGALDSYRYEFKATVRYRELTQFPSS